MVCSRCGVNLPASEDAELCWGCRVRSGERALQDWARHRRQWVSAWRTLVLLSVLLGGAYAWAKLWAWVGNR